MIDFGNKCSRMFRGTLTLRIAKSPGKTIKKNRYQKYRFLLWGVMGIVNIFARLGKKKGSHQFFELVAAKPHRGFAIEFFESLPILS